MNGRGSATLYIKTCAHRDRCTCDIIEFRDLRPLTCSKDPTSECYGLPMGFDPDYWIDTIWGRLYTFRCSSCGYRNHVDKLFMGRPYVVEVA
jgi:hypothetical protein